MSRLTRRSFLSQSLAAVTIAGTKSTGRVLGANETIRVGVCGIHGQGNAHIQQYLGLKGCQITYLIDPDRSLWESRSKPIKEKYGFAPKCVTDIREALEDKELDAVSIATPNHWHSLATVWACQAGKDVYVEKPVSHNIVEGRRMVQAARKYNRIVQVGTQRRSSPHWQAAHEYLGSGNLGKVSLARAWVIQKRVNIGKAGGPQPIPEGVDYDLWVGPAPMKPLLRKSLHYDWHWFWDYGGGELANNGIHMLDIARRGLGVDYPNAVASGGGKFYFDDDQETPDTQVVTYEYPDLSLVWEHRTWSNFGFEGRGSGVAYYGTQGTLVVDDNGWQVVVDGKVTDSGASS